MIELFAVWAGGKAGYLYNVTLDGELIVERSRDPECDLARALLSRGITGTVTFYDGNTGRPRTVIDVERAAKAITEDNRRITRFGKHKEGVAGEPSSPEEALVLPTMPPEANEAA